jgi:predicted Zn-dependent peptidase
VVTPPALTSTKARVVLVDRADAPQSVISVVKPGVAMSGPDFPALGRVNSALGGSFTSRLNQDLREDHGWTYGAKSRFSFTRGTGMFVASAAVITAKTPEALKALVTDTSTYAAEGPTRDEAEKTRLLLRAELVESYEGVSAIAARLGRQAALGLAPDFDEKASLTRDNAHRDDLAGLAKKYLGGPSLVVIVGPKSKIEAGLSAQGFGGFEVVTAEEP